MHTRGRYATILGLAALLTAVVFFVVAVRTGIIHDMAWRDACDALERGEAISGLHNTVNHCNNA